MTVSEQYRRLPKVIELVDSSTIVINRGSADGIKIGDLYLIFQLGKELFDPDTNDSLGLLEVLRGRARVVHVQERIATLRGTTSTKTMETALVFGLEEPSIPIRSEIGDFAKPI